MFRRFVVLALLIIAPFIFEGPTTVASASSQESVLYSFGGLDGAGPLWGVVAGSAGDVFGATVFGGTRSIGTIFQLTLERSGYMERVLYSFRGAEDGEKPVGIVRDPDGELFGFTAIGGLGGGGTAFMLSPARSGYRFRLLYGLGSSFGPVGAPVLGKRGALYGVSQFGGAANAGVVFKLTPSGQTYAMSMVYEFPGGFGGSLPQAGLTVGRDGSIYGTTYYGGNVTGCSGGCGEVFKITPTRTGYAERVLYRFQSWTDGAQPFGEVTVDDATGDVYGTT